MNSHYHDMKQSENHKNVSIETQFYRFHQTPDHGAGQQQLHISHSLYISLLTLFRIKKIFTSLTVNTYKNSLFTN